MASESEERVMGSPSAPMVVVAFKSPKQTLISVIKAGMAKGDLSVSDTFVLGFNAGAYIAFGGLLAVMVAGGMPGIAASDPGLRKLALGAVFPFGLMLVVLAGAELFTGNVMFSFAALLSRKVTWQQTVKNWGISYLGNFAGSVFVAYFLAYLPGLADVAPWQQFVMDLAPTKIQQGWGALVLKGVGCNWLVCLALWLAIASNEMIGKLVGIWWPIMAFVTIGFEHSVANMFFIPLSLFYDQSRVNFGEFIYRNLIPVTLGNIIGGAIFVAVVQWYIFAPHARPIVQELEVVPGKERRGSSGDERGSRDTFKHWSSVQGRLRKRQRQRDEDTDGSTIGFSAPTLSDSSATSTTTV